MAEVPVIVLDGLNENQRRALILADNKLALNAGWDEEALRLEIEALKDADYDLNLIGFEDEELAWLLESQDANGGLTDEDAVPELEEVPISVAGDLWRLGDHRVLCGDATAPSEVDRLIARDSVDLVFTPLTTLIMRATPESG
jgi:ParB-like chromosome segregation protein Spo0J